MLKTVGCQWIVFRSHPVNTNVIPLAQRLVMLKHLIALTLFLATANCFTQTSTDPVDSPATAFDHFTNGIVRTDYENYLRAQSLSNKKLLLLQAIQGVSLYYEDEFNALCAKHSIPFEQIINNAGGTDNMLHCILSCVNVDRFIQDLSLIHI